jgi:hypothetical protein
VNAEPEQLDVNERGQELATWVREVLAPVIHRDLQAQGELVWCQQWWEHPEAVARLAALHDAWTVLVVAEEADGTGASQWWVQHVDPHLDALMHQRHGPFSRCARHHRETKPLPWQEPPAGAIRIPIAAGDG